MRGVPGFLLTVAVGLAVGYGLHLYFKPEPPPPAPPTPFERLSVRVERDIDTIFSPLDDKGAPMPTQALRELRENFHDEMGRALPGRRPTYEAATVLCDSLLQAIGERERYLVRMVDSRANPSTASLARPPQQVSAGAYGSSTAPGYTRYGGPGSGGYQQIAPARMERPSMADSADQRREADRLNSFFEGAIKKDWANKAQGERRRVAEEYSRLRAMERAQL